MFIAQLIISFVRLLWSRMFGCMQFYKHANPSDSKKREL